MDNNLTRQEELSIDNEILKLKLETEHDASSVYVNPALDPEVANMWLKSVYDYETRYKNAPKRTVFEMIGKPEVKTAEEMNDEEIDKALADLLELMGRNKISLDWLDGYYTDRILSKFITEELFQVMMDDIDMEGLFHMFNYEEFHPNHKHDLSEHTTTLIECLMSSHDWNKYNPVFVADEIHSTTGELLSPPELIELIQKTQAECRPMQLKELKLDKVVFDEQSGRVDFTLTYTRSSESSPLMTTGHLCFINSYGFYEINEVYIPGLLVA